MDKGIESFGKFVVSPCNPAALLKSIKKSFNKILRLVPMSVDFTLNVIYRQYGHLCSWGLPGRKFAIRNHCSSVSIRLSIDYM